MQTIASPELQHTATTIMAAEARDATQVVARQLRENDAVLHRLAAKLQQSPPPFVVTIGRGSSDHACTFAKYLCETKLGLITASAAPSTVTVYHADLNFDHALVIGISQSGQSPDICAMMDAARRKGATTVALVNVADSPLARSAEFVIPLCAGEEKAVAATKSYIAALTALVHFIAVMTGSAELQRACAQLPQAMENATSGLVWREFGECFRSIHHTLIIGRGYGFPIAQEIALKFKETAAIQAEAFSAAELLHGPLALIKHDHPYLLLAQDDATLPEVLALALRIKELGGKSMLVLPENRVDSLELARCTTSSLTLPATLDAIFNPIVAVQALYLLIADLAVARGYNPDSPANLKKVTETL